jgi:outer membrane protein
MNRINTIILYTLSLSMILFLLYTNLTKSKVVYVDNIQLFSEFKMKKELEKKYKEVESIRKSILDSIYNEIRIKVEVKDANSESIDLLKKEFLLKKETYERENSETMTQYNEQIWNQLNEYTKQYGKENNYEFIFGASGQGVLMYAEDSKNITADLLEYVNIKYSGK